MDAGVNYDGTLFICETSWMRGLISNENCLFVSLHEVLEHYRLQDTFLHTASVIYIVT